jgi:MFS transporter, FHS family, glucose/mannose:H+ symporter
MSRENAAPSRGIGLKIGLYLGFAGTGVGVALPGALLPLLLRRWTLGDARGGLLLFCFFLATTTGALLSRGRMNRSIARGALLTSAGAVWLGFASRDWAFAAIVVYGLGLGIAMTSTSLLISRQFADERRVEMMRLNLLWAAGACAGPWLALGGQALKAGAQAARPLHILLGLTAFFAAFALWVWLALEPLAPARSDSPNNYGLAATRWPLAQIPLALLILVFCATGIESSTGGWLTAYAQRLGETAKITIGAATAFWVGLLSSRLIYSLRASARLSERTVLSMSAGLAAVGLAILVAWPGAAASVAAAVMAGLGAGPVYPLLLSIVLRRRESRGIFALAGVGSSALPLATGALSGWTHSLSAGLCVPLAAASMMTVLSLNLKADPEAVPGES